MAAMVNVEGQKWFRVESPAATIQALSMAGWQRTDRSGLMETWTKEGNPSVRITDLTPQKCPSCGARGCPGSAHCWGI